MVIHHERSGEVDIVSLQGELIMANCGEAKQRLQQIVNEGQGRLVLNLEQVPFVDSSGLAALVAALKAARGKRGSVALTRLRPEVYSLLELTRLHQVFDIFEHPQAATDHLSA